MTNSGSGDGAGHLTNEANNVRAGDQHMPPAPQVAAEGAHRAGNAGNDGAPATNGAVPNRTQEMPNALPTDVLLRKDFFDRLQEDKYTNGEPLYQHLAALAKRLHITSSVRFETARRHKKKNRMSTVSIIVLSFYAILFSMISTFGSLADKHSNLHFSQPR